MDTMQCRPLNNNNNNNNNDKFEIFCYIKGELITEKVIDFIISSTCPSKIMKNKRK